MDGHFKEFRFSNDGDFVAVGSWNPGSKAEVQVIRVSDGERIPVEAAPYDFGGHRLAIDPEPRRLFSGGYDRGGIAAFDDFDSTCEIWRRRDLRGVQIIEYDPLDDSLYCGFEKRAVVLDASKGTERAIYRYLKDVYFARDATHALFEGREIVLKDRRKNTVVVTPRQSDGIVRAAFTKSAVVISWGAGPITSHNLSDGHLMWTYPTTGTHAYCVAPASYDESVWIIEQPYEEPPWHRVRLLSQIGQVEQEIRSTLGPYFEVAPYKDKVICSDLSIRDIDTL